METIVSHCHVGPRGYFSSRGHNYKGKPEGFGTIDHLARLMDEMGIDRAVVFAPFPFTFEGDQNAWILQEVRNNPRMIPFACLNPTHDGAADDLRRAVERGAKGVKIHPSYARPTFRIDDPAIEEFYVAAEELRLPLCIHTGVHCGCKLKDCSPLLVDNVAQDHPKLPIVMEHTGGVSQFHDALPVIENNANVYAGLDGGSLLWEGGHEQLKRLFSSWQVNVIRPLGERVIYGTDFPARFIYRNVKERIRHDFQVIEEVDFLSDVRQDLLGNNIVSLVRNVGSLA
jgi:predicted TIM-barrel fold metal-dependent hydrolase